MDTGGAFITTHDCSQEIFTRENFNAEQSEIGKIVEDFARKRIRPNKEAIEKYNKELTLELLNECAEMGLLSVDIPEQFDGLGLDKVTSAIVAENLARGFCASFSTTVIAHTGIGTLPIVFFGNEEQKKKYLPKLGSGEWIAAYALTEPESGSDATAAKTIATLSADGKHYILNGTKQFITNAQWAQVFTTFANVNGDKFTGFLIERSTPGLSIGPEEKKMGVKGSSTCSVYLEDVKVPVENVLGEIGKGAAIAFNSLNIGRFKLGAALLGVSKTAIEEALAYASDRRQFGQAIRNFDQLKGYFADMVINTFALESIVYRTIGHINKAIEAIPDASKDYNKQVAGAIENYAIEASIVKVFGSECIASVADTALQIFGGNGFIEEYPLASVVRDTRIDRVWEGTNEINRQIVAGYFLKKALMEELPIREAINKINPEAFAAVGEKNGQDLLFAEKQAFEAARQLTLYTFGETISQYGQDLLNHQQIGTTLVNMFIDVYLVSSVLSRYNQQITNGKAAPVWLKIVKTLCLDRIPNITTSAQRVLHAITAKPYLKKAQKDLTTFRTRMQLVGNIFQLKQEIAEVLYEEQVGGIFG